MTNEEAQAMAEKVMPLIDAIDRAMIECEGGGETEAEVAMSALLSHVVRLVAGAPTAQMRGEMISGFVQALVSGVAMRLAVEAAALPTPANDQDGRLQ